jgi:hypothetical protein
VIKEILLALFLILLFLLLLLTFLLLLGSDRRRERNSSSPERTGLGSWEFLIRTSIGAVISPPVVIVLLHYLITGKWFP